MAGIIDTEHKYSKSFEDEVSCIHTMSCARDGHRHWFTDVETTGYLVPDNARRLVSISSGAHARDIEDSLFTYRDTDILMTTYEPFTKRWVTDSCQHWSNKGLAVRYAKAVGTQEIYSLRDGEFVPLEEPHTSELEEL